MQKIRFYHAASRIFIGLCLAFAATSANADSANADVFTDLQKAAKGQTIYFNAWGGDAKSTAISAGPDKSWLIAMILPLFMSN